jgi:putative transposase
MHCLSFIKQIDMHLFNTRQGQMNQHNLYFFTQTIHHFKPLLASAHIQQIVLDSLSYLHAQQLVSIYGFVIMPNHLHLLWRMEEHTRNESAAASFSKFTSHQFKQYLLANDPEALQVFQSDKTDRRYQFWKRDPLAIPITSQEALVQKLEYIHLNPVKAGLCMHPSDYTLSSASFYETGVDRFGFLFNIYV